MEYDPPLSLLGGLDFGAALVFSSIFSNARHTKLHGYESANLSKVALTYLHCRVQYQEHDSEGPAPFHRRRKRLGELPLAPLCDDQEFSNNGRQQQPDMLAHSHGLSDQGGRYHYI